MPPPDAARKFVAFGHLVLLPQTINPRKNPGMVDFKVVRSCSVEESLSFSPLTHHDGFFFRMSGKCFAWENSWHFAMLSLVSLPSDVWETNAEIPYWWRISTQIWVVLLIGCATWEIWFNQSEILSRSGSWFVISMEFLCLFLRRRLAGRPVAASPNVGCFLRLGNVKFYGSPKSLGIIKYCQ